MSQRVYKDCSIISIKVTVSNAGIVIAPSKTTSPLYTRLVGISVNYDNAANLPGSLLNIKVSNKPLFESPVETALFTFDSSCPVNDRYYNLIDVEIAQALLEVFYTPGAAFPAGDTTMYVYFQVE